ncbi:oligopeptide/dipeptide ABC transporter ATP-binding protein, partial [Streptomyces sp. NPDC058953]|uniref:oligopeptide/dipeptide ABC transporter ATP-binding protein n=1 Tax=Streptomyces sp. NPDC058953 TaxID=3346676 RepID=UPI00369141A2
ARELVSGPCAAVFHTPRPPYTHSPPASLPVHDPRPPAPGAGTRLRAEPPDPTDPPPGCRFQRACAFATDLCRTEPPPSTPVGGTEHHTVACHHHGTPAVRAALTIERTTTS